MKKILFAIAACAAVVSGISCSANKTVDNDVTCGGFGKEVPVNAEDSVVWNVAISKRPDLKDCAPKTVSRQVVAGMNYEFTCTDKAGKSRIVRIFASLPGQGDTTVTYPTAP